MSVICRHGKGFRLYCKGAPERVLDDCMKWWSSEGVRPLDAAARSALLSGAYGMQSRGLRTLAIAYRDFEYDEGWDESEPPPESKMIMLAVFGIKVITRVWCTHSDVYNRIQCVQKSQQLWRHVIMQELLFAW